MYFHMIFPQHWQTTEIKKGQITSWIGNWETLIARAYDLNFPTILRFLAIVKCVIQKNMEKFGQLLQTLKPYVNSIFSWKS